MLPNLYSHKNVLHQHLEVARAIMFASKRQSNSWHCRDSQSALIIWMFQSKAWKQQAASSLSVYDSLDDSATCWHGVFARASEARGNAHLQLSLCVLMQMPWTERGERNGLAD